MSKGIRTQEHPETPLAIAASRWIGGSCLELIHDFNNRFLESLARSAQWGPTEKMPDILRGHERLWSAMDAQARLRASRCPFILADLNFSDADWWQRTQSEKRPDRMDLSEGLFPWIVGMEMARDALTVAWFTAREDVCLATLLIGMSAEVAQVVAKFSLHQLWQVADREHQRLRPRCENRSAFWGRLLSAAVRDDRETLHDLHRHAFLLADAEYGSRASAQGRAGAARN